MTDTTKSQPTIPCTHVLPRPDRARAGGGGSRAAHPHPEHGRRRSPASKTPSGSYTGSKHAIGVNSGTAGLHLCVRAAGIGDGDLVITTPFSFVASANVLLFERAVPVFVDVEPRTGNIDPDLVKAAAQDLATGRRAAQALAAAQGRRARCAR